VGILATNTPAFLEALFGIGGAGAVNIGEETMPAFEKMTDLSKRSIIG
jgi:hypothetical protein